MVLVTGASGKTGKVIIRSLAKTRNDIRALVHHMDRDSAVIEAGAREVIVGDMGALQLLEEATQGIELVYHICPNVSPDEVIFGRNIIKAAQRSGVQRLVYHSVLHPQIEAMPHHWAKMRVEEMIFESGLPFTIIQPAAYMQNLLVYWDEILANRYPVPYGPDTLLGLVDLNDVAEVAAIVINDPTHTGSIYELCGPDVFTQLEIAAILEAILGYSVQFEQVPIEEWKMAARGKGLGDYQVRALRMMFDYYDNYGFWGNPKTLSWLLGRKPNSLRDFLRRYLSDKDH